METYKLSYDNWYQTESVVVNVDQNFELVKKLASFCRLQNLPEMIVTPVMNIDREYTDEEVDSWDMVEDFYYHFMDAYDAKMSEAMEDVLYTNDF